jgi:PAS domain S-box-containing protein
MNTQQASSVRRLSAPSEESGPGFRRHSVQFYSNDRAFIDQLIVFLSDGIKAGNPCLVVATEAHREAILAALGPDRLNHMLCLDAAEALSAITLYGFPEQSRFNQVIGGAVSKLLNAAQSRSSRVTAFGEMVALLWEQGKTEAALQLEQLWNNLLVTHPISLRCAYPLAGFDRAAHSRVFQQICAEHSHVLPDESYTALGDEAQRLRAISILQQRALALETEIKERKRTEEELRISEERLRLTQKAARIGTWELDLETDSCVLSEEAASMLGLMNGCGTSADLLGAMYYSGDRENFERCLKLAASKNREFEAEFRLTRSGRVRWISARGKAFYNQGRPLLLGVLIDITAGKKAQNRRLSRQHLINASGSRS